MAFSGNQNDDQAPQPPSRVEFSAWLSKAPVIYVGFVCTALVAGLFFFWPAASIEDKKAMDSSPPARVEHANPKRAPADWSLRQIAGLRLLVPNDFREYKFASESKRKFGEVLSRFTEPSEDFESSGGGFYVVVVHAVARPDVQLGRDLERAAWDSVDKLNPALVDPDPDKSVSKSQVKGADAYRASCRAINRGIPARFETVTFERDRDWWLVSILLTGPTSDGMDRIEQIMDSIEITIAQ